MPRRRGGGWLVLHMDDGLIRRADTRKAAVQWCTGMYGPVLRRSNIRPGAYYYVFGYRDSYRNHDLFVERYDVATDPNRGGWQVDADTVAKYPYADRPYDERDEKQ